MRYINEKDIRTSFGFGVFYTKGFLHIEYGKSLLTLQLWSKDSSL